MNPMNKILTAVAICAIAVTALYQSPANAAAIRRDGDFDLHKLPAGTYETDDEVELGFSISFLLPAPEATVLFNTEGLVSIYSMYPGTPDQFEAYMGYYSSFFAPFCADIDTTNTTQASHGPITVGGRDAYAFNWIDVGYYGGIGNPASTERNDIQLVIIDRNDTGPGNFDFEFNYDKIEWETGYNEGGVDGLGGLSAQIGWSTLNSDSYDFRHLIFSGSGEATGTHPTLDNHPFLDSNTTGTALVSHSYNSCEAGRYVFRVRNPAWIYWKGQHASDNSWSAANWAVNDSGVESLVPPSSESDVVFSIEGGGSDQLSTTLPACFHIHSLTVDDEDGMTVSGFTLFLDYDETVIRRRSGIFIKEAAGPVTINSNVALNADSLIVVDNEDGLVITGDVSGTVLNKQGSGKLDLTGSVLQPGMVLNIYAGEVILSESQKLASIYVASSAKLTMALHSPGSPKTIDTYALDIDFGGTLDLGVDQLVLRAGGSVEHAANIGKVRTLLSDAYNGSFWGGPGITSSEAEYYGPINGAVGIMMADNEQLGKPCFGTAEDLDEEDYYQVLVKTTYFGDLDLSGFIDGTDYAFMDAYLGSPPLHIFGDLNFDDVIDGGDYAILDAVLGSQDDYY